MNTKNYKRVVRFRDANMHSFEIKIEIHTTEKPAIHIDKSTLDKFEEIASVSVSGHGPMNCGQCQDSINPRTKGQIELLNFWYKYHLNGMSAGTELQNEYLHKKYKNDYEELITFFDNRGKNKVFVNKWEFDDFKALAEKFKINDLSGSQARIVIWERMEGNPINYILGYGKHKKHDSSDLYVKYLLLAINGLYADREYRYGTSWLYTPIPEDIFEIADSICDKIEQEEKELSESINPVFDMGNEHFEPNNESVSNVMHLRTCSENEAYNFIALGMYLECTFGDLNETLQIHKDKRLYKANGHYYFVGTYEELEEVARNIMVGDSDMKYFWKESDTLLSFNEWVDLVLKEDGFGSILNHYDGTHKSFVVNEKPIYVCPYC